MDRRLFKELKDAHNAPPDSEIRLDVLDPGDVHHWKGIIDGPPDSPYAGFRLTLDIQVGSTYPIHAPRVRFDTKVFHPNVDFKTGEICLDILKENWSPSWSLESLCRAIIALLGSPEPSSPLNCDAGNMLRAGDARAFCSMARMYCQLYAEEGRPPVAASEPSSSGAHSR